MSQVQNGIVAENINRDSCFHLRYMDMCRIKSAAPLTEVRGRKNNMDVLEFFGEKIKVRDWLMICGALYYDTMLVTIAIKLRKCCCGVIEYVDTEVKANRFQLRSVIFTKYIFSSLIAAVSNCLKNNSNLQVLKLEGLPLHGPYLAEIVEALTSNKSLQEISFQRSTIGDTGCESICHALKNMYNVEKLDLSECDLTTRGAEAVADLIKLQKISRFSEAWQESLRYRLFDPNSVQGLHCISLAFNPRIGDDGLKVLVETLKEDAFITHIDMTNCGLTNASTDIILECLNINQNLSEFKITGNPNMSSFSIRKITDFWETKEHNKQQNDALLINMETTNDKKLMEGIQRTLERLLHERNLRKKAESTNEMLMNRINHYENQLNEDVQVTAAQQIIPKGYVVVKVKALEALIKDRNELQEVVEVMDSKRKMSAPLEIIPEEGSTSIVSIVPVVDASRPLTGLPTTMLQRSTAKVREIKSERLYIEPARKDALTKGKSKSDYTLNELKPIQIEKNNGDTIANNRYSTDTQSEQHYLRIETSRSDTYIKKYGYSYSSSKNFQQEEILCEELEDEEIDELDIPSARTIKSGRTNDLETLRNRTGVLMQQYLQETWRPQTYTSDEDYGSKRYKESNEESFYDSEHSDVPYISYDDR